MAKVVSLLMALLFIASSVCAAQVPQPKAELLINCSETDYHPEPLTPYGFAKATLMSLWYARNADRSSEIMQLGKDSDNPFSLITGLMRITKTSTNDFVCAKRSIKRSAVKQTGENISTAANFFMMVYDEHMQLNGRMLDVYNKMSSQQSNPSKVMDEISTLQVERGERWADLVKPTGLAFMSLVDLNRLGEDGNLHWLTIKKAQRQTLVDWENEQFPELTNGTPEGQWSNPTKTAHFFITMFSKWRCSDE